MDNKRYALLIARKIPHGTVEELLANAAKIEGHLDGGSGEPFPTEYFPLKKDEGALSPADMEREDRAAAEFARDRAIYDKKLEQAQVETHLKAIEKQCVAKRKEVEKNLVDKGLGELVMESLAEVPKAFAEMTRKAEDEAKVWRDRLKASREIYEHKPKLVERVDEPAPEHMVRSKRVARKYEISGTLANDGDAITLNGYHPDTTNAVHFKMVNQKGVIHIVDDITLDLPTVSPIHECRITYDDGKVTYWSGHKPTEFLRQINVSQDIELTPMFLGQPKHKAQTESEQIIVEEQIDFDCIEEMIEKKSREEMGKWLNLVKELPQAAWVKDRPVKVQTPTGYQEVKWSGLAEDLRELINHHNMVLSTARQIGTSTFLLSVAAEHSFNQKVCFVTNSCRMMKEMEMRLKPFPHDPENVVFHSFESFIKLDPKEVHDFGIVIVDNAAFLPYRDSAAFSQRLAVAKKIVMASTPAQAAGVFHDIRVAANDPTSLYPFVGFDLPWNTPLKWVDQTDWATRISQVMKNIGDAFDNEFQCKFRPVQN